MTDRTRIALAALVRDGRVLLVHRHPSRRAYPDRWDLVGGHVEAGETPLQAVGRECHEEVGVHVRDVRPMPFTTADPRLEVTAFLVRRWDGDPVNAAPDEHDALRWFGAEELAVLRVAHPTALPDLVAALRDERA